MSDIVLIDFGGAASPNDGINIYSSPFTRSSLISKLENKNISKVKESPKDSYIGCIKTIIFLEKEVNSYLYSTKEKNESNNLIQNLL